MEMEGQQYHMKTMNQPMKFSVSFVSNISKGTNIGARNQALGVIEAMRRMYDTFGAELDIVEYDLHRLDNLKAFTGSALSDPPPVMITVGNDGVDALKRVPRPRTYFTVLLGHEVPQNLEKASDVVDILAIPEHITDYQEFENIHCIRTQGVSHAITRDKVTKALSRWKDKMVGSDDRPVVVVMIGGSVDDKHYDPQETFLLGKYALEKATAIDGRIIATNSPRTSAEALEAFSNATENSGRTCMFLPCTGNTDASPFQAMLGLVAGNSRSCVIVTGDSVSMPCEAGSIVLPSQLVVFSVSNQNAQNTNFVNWMHEKGRAEVIGYDAASNSLVKLPERQLSPVALDAPLQIAEAIHAYLTQSIQQRM